MAIPASPYRLRIPTQLWADATAVLQHYGDLDAEGLVYFSGVIGGPDEVVVTGLLQLGHAPQGDAVRVTPQEARWLVQTLRQRDEKLVAQLHSHRAGARHSPGDDAFATSFHDGFLSVVVPSFKAAPSSLEGVGFHEFRDGGFRQFSAAEVSERIRLVAEVAMCAPLPGKEESWWARFVKRARRIGQKRP